MIRQDKSARRDFVPRRRLERRQPEPIPQDLPLPRQPGTCCRDSQLPDARQGRGRQTILRGNPQASLHHRRQKRHPLVQTACRRIRRDPRRIITGGGSAGGHISVLATINAGPQRPRRPEGHRHLRRRLPAIQSGVLAGRRQGCRGGCAAPSPAWFPPRHRLLWHQDKWKIGWDAAHEKLKSLGNTAADLQLAEGQAHGFFNNDPWQTVTLIAADRFLVRQGLLQANPRSPRRQPARSWLQLRGQPHEERMPSEETTPRRHAEKTTTS